MINESGGDLLSNCCAADFDVFGYEKSEGIWQERCLNCGKLCEPLWISDINIINIHNCLKWEPTPPETEGTGQ